ncbi:MAG: SprT family zinc-dependent metalloprotease [Pararhodobacter sp.]
MRDDPEVTHIEGDPPLAVHWRRSARARRMSLKVSRLDGQITLTLPRRASLRAGMAFLKERHDWLHEVARGLEPPSMVAPGTRLPVEGRLLTVTPAPVRSARIDDDRLLVPEARPAAGAMAFLKHLARDRLASRVSAHARGIDRSPGKLTLRDTRSRWGSCTAAGDLMFNWRLVMAPPSILDYVAAHEVAHLVHMDHSAAFWSLCEHLFPDTARARAWLKAEGAHLHRFRFASG